MSTMWISNTIYLHGFSDIRHLFSFMVAFREHPRNDDGIVVPDAGVIDIDYLTINVSNVQSRLRLSVSFLTDHHIAQKNISRLHPDGFDDLKLTYSIIDTRTDAVELYTYVGRELSSHKSVPKGLGRTLREELETLPDPGKNLSLTLYEFDLMDYEEFESAVGSLFPEHIH